MAEEALACFNLLLENVPKWLADLDSLLKTAADRQQEMISVNQPTVPDEKLCADRRTSLSSSLRSRRSRVGSVKRELQVVQHPPLKRLTNSDELRLSQRKRKTTSVCSRGQGGPVQYRTKAAVVVYYDGDTQQQFERLVRAVGLSRNAIRKGKMNTRLVGLARSGSSSFETSSSDSGRDGSDDCSPSRMNFRSTRVSTRGPTDDTAAFDKVDGHLEKVQAMCERAAHQVLRDGDCSPEVNKAKEHLADALQFTEGEMPRLQRRADRAAARRKRSEERRRMEAEAEERRKSASQASEKIINGVPNPFPPDIKLEVDELEVDDASDDDGAFNISAMRGHYGKFASIRSARFATR